MQCFLETLLFSISVILWDLFVKLLPHVFSECTKKIADWLLYFSTFTLRYLQISRNNSKRTVDALKPSGPIAWDRTVTGFGVRCQKKGKLIVLKRRVRGKQRWFTIGEYGNP